VIYLKNQSEDETAMTTSAIRESILERESTYDFSTFPLRGWAIWSRGGLLGWNFGGIVKYSKKFVE
jgi:hypothetical protein